MDTSVGEQSTDLSMAESNPSSAPYFSGFFKTVIGFFNMSENDYMQAGIVLDKHREAPTVDEFNSAANGEANSWTSLT